MFFFYKTLIALNMNLTLVLKKTEAVQFEHSDAGFMMSIASMTYLCSVKLNRHDWNLNLMMSVVNKSY